MNSMKTSYACQGSKLNLSCPSGFVIKIMRANYGRFSVAICNEDGITDWSVNCMAPRSLRILQDRYEKICKNITERFANTAFQHDYCNRDNLGNFYSVLYILLLIVLTMSYFKLFYQFCFHLHNIPTACSITSERNVLLLHFAL